MPLIQNPRFVQKFVYCGLSLLLLTFFLILSHTVLRRSLEGEDRVFESASYFDSHDSDVSEVVGAAAKEALKISAQTTEEERRQQRISRHPFASRIIEIERLRGEPVFSIPRDNRCTLDEAVRLYEEKIKKLRCAPKQREENIMYALKQQANFGDIRTLRPCLFNYRAYLDWRAWSSLKGRDREFCKRKYVKFMKLLIFKYGLKAIINITNN